MSKEKPGANGFYWEDPTVIKRQIVWILIFALLPAVAHAQRGRGGRSGGGGEIFDRLDRNKDGKITFRAFSASLVSRTSNSLMISR